MIDPLVPGIYESVLTARLQQQLASSELDAEFEHLTEDDEPHVYARHIAPSSSAIYGPSTSPSVEMPRMQSSAGWPIVMLIASRAMRCLGRYISRVGLHQSDQRHHSPTSPS